MILRIAPSSILACLAFAALVPAQRDLASVFPADSWAFVEFAGLDAGNRAFQAAKLVGIARQALGDEGWQAVENAVRQQGGRDLAEARGVFARVGIAPQQVRRLLAGAIAVG